MSAGNERRLLMSFKTPERKKTRVRQVGNTLETDRLTGNRHTGNTEERYRQRGNSQTGNRETRNSGNK